MDGSALAPMLALDETATLWLNHAAGAAPPAAWDLTWWAITQMGSWPAVLPLVAAAWEGRAAPGRRFAARVLCAVGALVLAVVLAQAAKRAVIRPRPGAALAGVHMPFDPIFARSFPSGHATCAAAAAAAVVALRAARRRTPPGAPRALAPIAAVAATLALLAGASRVALGYHYVSDVLAGLLLGASTGGAACVLLLGRFAPGDTRAAPAGGAPASAGAPAS